ncbi:GNAT family N-acetyltransferase [Cuspidothrix issatschenkoi LEGE 03284]|jgi:putative hemolysin|uniref:GNAT family N-acetyltransferase n=1 Tax=Cuspidothrix issatschenkoi TaxID=230752 RepID=UPI001882F482|nr:GNAT family N-acyltransferase [Cuspidothrix issatschenkoi]MBE9232064.1 GNAT family N-acetyltransferase [Cuspidothrix issatschenkoi LEGE 03284]
MEISYHYNNYQLHPPDFPTLQTDKYILRLATNAQELESIFRLRFEVFNLELGLGLSSANSNQMDQDKFDEVCHHLLLIAKNTGETIGTYRMQTYTMAAQCLGFDAADIFNLHGIPDSVLQSSVEVGRACIAKKYRNSHTLLLLWKGLANYLIWTRKQYFFGCASLLTQSHWEAACTFNYLRQHNFIHPHILVAPHSQYLIEVFQNYPENYHLSIPNIFQAYLTIGAKVCSLPAIDKQFKTIDFLIIANIGDFARWHYSHITGLEINIKTEST